MRAVKGRGVAQVARVIRREGGEQPPQGGAYNAAVVRPVDEEEIGEGPAPAAEATRAEDGARDAAADRQVQRVWPVRREAHTTPGEAVSSNPHAICERAGLYIFLILCAARDAAFVPCSVVR